MTNGGYYPNQGFGVPGSRPQGSPSSYPQGWNSGQPGHGQPQWGAPQAPYGYGPPPPIQPPLTLPGWGLLPAALGFVMVLLGLLVFNWAEKATFFDVREPFLGTFDAGLVESGFGYTLLHQYVLWAVFVLVGLMVIVIAWTAGALRGNNSARRKVTGFRVTIGIFSIAILALHIWMWLLWTNNDLFVFGAGPRIVALGQLLLVVGAFIGPRTPRLKRAY